MVTYDPEPPKKIDTTTWEDKEGRIYKLSETTMEITMVHNPHMWDREYILEDYPVNPSFSPPDPSVFEVVDYVIEKLKKDRFILGPSGNGVELTMLGEMERALSEYILNPEIVKAAAAYKFKKGNYEDEYFIRDGQDAVFWGQDFSYKSGPLISPAMFAEFVVPYTKQRMKNIKSKFHLPVLKHACGNNWKLLDMFLEIGYAAYQSIQPSAEMDIKAVKEQYGHKICLWGGIPVEHMLGGTREDIKKDLAYAVEVAKPFGGFILGTSHSIAVGTKYDNFMTLIDEFEKVRDY